MVICLERCADLHMAHLMPLPLTVSCFSKTQIGFIFLVPAHLGIPGKGQLNARVCVCCRIHCELGCKFSRYLVLGGKFLEIYYGGLSYRLYVDRLIDR